MIQELREYSNSIFFKILLGIIAITFVLSFGVGGFFGDRKEVIATVNDNEILLREYRDAYQNRIKALREQFGERTDEIAEQINLRQQVFEQLIDRYLLLSEAADMNLMTTDLELQDYIRNQPFFQKKGQFDYATYETVLSQNRIVRHEYENSLRADILLTKKQQLIGVGLVINDREVEQAYRRDFEKIVVDYVYFDPQVFVDQTNANESELRQYHLENPDQFKTLNQFRMEFFTLSTDDFKNNVNVREREIRRYFKKYQDNFVTPSEIKARHILFKLAPDASEELLQEKRQQLAKLLDQIKGGASFEELAIKHSEDGTASEGGDLGWFKAGEMVPEFENAAFVMETGQVSEIVRTPFGLHLIKVEQRKQEITKSLDEVRDEITEILAESRAQKLLDEELEKMLELARESFTEEAQRLNKEVKKSEWFDRNDVIPGLGSVNELITELELRVQGEMGIWKRNPVMGHVIYRVGETKEPSVRNFEDVKSDVENEVRLEKAEVLSLEAAKKTLTQVRGGEDFESLAQQQGLSTEIMEFTANTRFLPLLGDNSEFRKVGLHLNENEPFGLSVNEKRADLIRFRKRTFADGNLEEQKENVRIQLLQNLQQALLRKELKRLRESAEIEVINPVFRLQESS